MRHFIFPRPSFTRPVFAGAVSARSRRMPDPAAAARLVAPPRGVQRPPARTRRAVGAVGTRRGRTVPAVFRADVDALGFMGRATA
jgi:hypothetical protein